jgi:hypothetical protein
MTIWKLSLACSLAIAAHSSFAGNCYQLKAGGKVCKGGYATGYLSDCKTQCSTARAPTNADATKGAPATAKKANSEVVSKAKPEADAVSKKAASSASK